VPENLCTGEEDNDDEGEVQAGHGYLLAELCLCNTAVPIPNLGLSFWFI
jgi:hypothetical protein